MTATQITVPTGTLFSQTLTPPSLPGVTWSLNNWHTEDGTALKNEDYIPGSGAGWTIQVQTLNDHTDDVPVETFKIVGTMTGVYVGYGEVVPVTQPFEWDITLGDNTSPPPPEWTSSGNVISAHFANSPSGANATNTDWKEKLYDGLMTVLGEGAKDVGPGAVATLETIERTKDFQDHQTSYVTNLGNVVFQGIHGFLNGTLDFATFEKAVTQAAFGAQQWHEWLSKLLPGPLADKAAVLVFSQDDTSSETYTAHMWPAQGIASQTLPASNMTDVIYDAAGTHSDQINALAGDDIVLSGSGNDQILGGSGNDLIDAGKGNNFVDAGTGNDVVIDGSGVGNDVYNGGAGFDTMSYDDATAGVTANIGLKGAQDTVGAGIDSLTGFENLSGSSFDDHLTGSKTANVIDGGVGNDTLTGGAGNDTVNGGAGDDVIVIGGKDAAGDVISGGDGTDTIEVTGTTAVSLGGLGVSASIEQWHGNGMGVLGSSASDKLDFSGLNAVSGLSYIDGGAGNDVITGTKFNDDLRGGVGNDTLTGGVGDDHLTGGKGSDIFAYNDFNFGHDTIADFTPGTDKLSFDHSVFNDFAGAMAHAAQVGADVVITQDASDSIALHNVAIGSLHSGDFLFH